jgi:hypothetical protein
MYKIIIIIALIITVSCASQKKVSSNQGEGDTRTKVVELLDEHTYLLTEASEEKSYGFEKNNPIKVGGIKEKIGPLNERRYLNALLGPNGEEVIYKRSGSCCAFKTPNGLIENSGMLDRYQIYWTGARDTLTIYINMYDKGDLKIPVGLTSRKN